MAVRIERIIIIILSVMLFSVWHAYAGTPAGPGTPPASTSSYTLSDIYNRLNNGTAGTPSAFTEPSVAPGTPTMYTLNQIYNLIGERAGVPKTGQTTSYATGDDGDLEKGVAWPSPRFTDNSNGTVTDNLTGLIWLKNANCSETVSGITGGLGNYWADALTFANNLASGSCGLTDSSTAGQWRLPNVRELYSLIDLSQSSPALSSGHPFTNVQGGDYWSSTTYPGSTTNSWHVYLPSGYMGVKVKTANMLYVWPVRGGQ